MAMGFSLKTAKERAKKLGSAIKSGFDKLEKYKADEPIRRQQEIKKLKDEIEIEKLRKHKRQLMGASSSDSLTEPHMKW